MCKYILPIKNILRSKLIQYALNHYSLVVILTVASNNVGKYDIQEGFKGLISNE